MLWYYNVFYFEIFSKLKEIPKQIINKTIDIIPDKLMLNPGYKISVELITKPIIVKNVCV